MLFVWIPDMSDHLIQVFKSFHSAKLFLLISLRLVFPYTLLEENKYMAHLLVKPIGNLTLQRTIFELDPIEHRLR